MIREKEQIAPMLRSAALRMMSRARTAPKIKGLDLLEMFLAEEEDVARIREEIIRIGTRADLPFYIRDAIALEETQAMLLIGSRDRVRNLDECALCGAPVCSQKHKDTPCAYTALELGLAYGSALAAAQDFGIDCRLMLSAAKAAQSLGLFSEDIHTALALPLSISSKNIFFDRSL